MQEKPFLVRVSFGMLANEECEQTLSQIGIDHKSDFFTHGQLCVAICRVEDPETFRILAKGTNKEKNYISE